MTWGDGTQYGGSEPAGAGVQILRNAVYGNPVTQYKPELAPLIVVFTPDLTPVGP